MINAIINGQTKTNVTKLVATDGNNSAEVLLSESGVIPTPTDVKNITENGTYDVSAFASAVVNVAAQGGTQSELTMRFGTVSPEGSIKLYIPIEQVEGKECFYFVAIKTTDDSNTSAYIISGFVNGGYNDTTGLDNFRGLYGVETESELNSIMYKPTTVVYTARSSSNVRDGYIFLDRMSTENNYSTGDVYSYVLFYK